MVELCRVTRVSERTLQYVFSAEYGVTPIEFVRIRRLQLARRELLSASQGANVIRGIVRRCGYRHGGKFAAAYRGPYGEFPSDTLRRDASP